MISAIASNLSDRAFYLILLLSLGWLGPLNAAPLSSASAVSQTENVVSVESVSFDKEDLQAIQKALGLYPGRPLDNKRIDEGIQALYAQGKIQSLFVEGVEVPGGLKVLVRGARLRRLRNIRFINADAEVLEEIRGKVSLERGQALDMQTLNVLREKLKSFYETRGYYFADVQIILNDVAQSQDTDLDVIVRQNQPTVVRRIVMIGAFKSLNDDILEVIPLKTGKFFSKVQLDDSIEKINRFFRANQYPTSKVEDSTLSFNQDKTEVDVTLLLKLNDRVQFSFHGNYVFPDTQLRELLTEEILSQADANNRLIELLESKYKKVGYHFCRVKSRVVHRPLEKLNVVIFDIEEGDKVLIDEATFGDKGGKTNFEWKTMFFQNAPGVLKRRIYWEDGISEAVNNFRMQVESLGFLNASVPSPRAIFSEDRRGVQLFFDFEPGTRTVVVRYDIRGAEHFKREELVKLMPIPEGEAFNRQRMVDGKKGVVGFYQSHGYLDVKVDQSEADDTQIGRDQRNAIIHLNIDEGPQYHVGKIIVEGNRKTQTKVISREIVVKEGDVYNPIKVGESEENLEVLGLFSKVEVVNTPQANNPTVKDLKVIVKETMPGVGEIGLGLAYEDPFFRIRPFTGASYRNVMGLNNTASVHGEVSFPVSTSATSGLIPFIEYAAIVGYRAPAPFELPVTFSAQLGFDGFEVALNGPTLEYRARVETKLEHKFSPHFTGIYRIYRFERTTTDNLSDPTQLVRESIGSTGPGAVFDFRDDTFNPTHGSYHTLDFEFATPYLLSQDTISFFMFITRNSFYIPLFSPFSFSMSIAAGYAKSIFARDPLPQARLTNDLALGGRGSLRGYAVGAFIAPADTVELAFYNTRFELTTQLFQNISFAVFLDSGQLYPQWAPQGRHDGAGVGLRYRTPVGPIVIDIAEGIEDSTGIQFYFTVGTL